jgi:hypothetical protein
VLSLGLLGILALRNLGRWVQRGDWESVLGVAVAIGLGLAGAWMFRRGKRHLAPTVQELLAADPRPPVLYLRMFRDDAVAAMPGGVAWLPALSEEEQLVRALAPVGPVVAIGRPGERLPELGAAREYVPEGEWRAVVAGYMQRARLVVLRAGSSQGVAWEMAEAARRLRPEQVVFLIPHDREAYEAFRTEAQRHFPRPWPDHGDGRACGSLRGLVHFEPDWTPRFATFPRAPFRTGARGALLGRLVAGLRPVFERLGVPWRPAPVSWWQVYVAVMLGAGLLSLVVMLLLFALGLAG